MSSPEGLASATEAQRQVRHGFVAALSAYIIWGVSPLFFHSLGELSPLEVVAHRVVWSLITITAVLLYTGGWTQALAILRAPRKLIIFAGSALAITINWVVFVHAATTGHGLDASMGYYVFPLVTVLLAAVVLKERFSLRQGVALGVVVCGVAAMVIGLGRMPWISLSLALSFGVYGLLRKTAPAESLVGLFVETLLLAPFAIGFLLYQHITGVGLTHLGSRPDLWAMLIIGTPLWTGLPLFLFAVGARRLRLATVGLMQYLNPTCQFVIATTVFGETFTITHAITFGLIWCGVVIYSWPVRRTAAGSLKSS